MAFGEHSGPPATARQVQELLALLEAAGHAGFRDARGPLAFTQRQAAGRFTRDEADAFIASLRDTGSGICSAAPAPPVRRKNAVEDALRRATSEQLAAELQGRGWVVLEP